VKKYPQTMPAEANPKMIIGIALLAIAIVHEGVWLRRRRWRRATGQIVACMEERESRGDTFLPGVIYTPYVEYVLDGERHGFTSRYGRSIPYCTGVEVDVLISPDGSNAEIYSMFSRTLWTAGPLLGGCVLLGSTF
jgi:hypothetical protein